MTTNLDTFKASYSHLWGPKAEKVRQLRLALESRYPCLRGAIRVGHGAESADFLRYPPHEKGEADLTLFSNYKVLCHIEHTGSDRVRVPPSDIRLRPDKIALADEKEATGEPYFFYLEYANGSLVLTPERIRAYPRRIVRPVIRGRQETYIAIPPEAALDPAYLFSWLANRLR